MALFFWDNKKEEEQLAQISRDETLSRLPLRLSTNRVVELVQLRDTVRPVSIPTNYPCCYIVVSLSFVWLQILTAVFCILSVLHHWLHSFVKRMTNNCYNDDLSKLLTVHVIVTKLFTYFIFKGAVACSLNFRMIIYQSEVHWL